MTGRTNSALQLKLNNCRRAIAILLALLCCMSYIMSSGITIIYADDEYQSTETGVSTDTETPSDTTPQETDPQGTDAQETEPQDTEAQETEPADTETTEPAETEDTAGTDTTPEEPIAIPELHAVIYTDETLTTFKPFEDHTEITLKGEFEKEYKVIAYPQEYKFGGKVSLIIYVVKILDENNEEVKFEAGIFEIYIKSELMGEILINGSELPELYNYDVDSIVRDEDGNIIEIIEKKAEYGFAEDAENTVVFKNGEFTGYVFAVADTTGEETAEPTDTEPVETDAPEETSETAETEPAETEPEETEPEATDPADIIDTTEPAETEENIGETGYETVNDSEETDPWWIGFVDDPFEYPDPVETETTETETEPAEIIPDETDPVETTVEDTRDTEPSETEPEEITAPEETAPAETDDTEISQTTEPADPADSVETNVPEDSEETKKPEPALPEIEDKIYLPENGIPENNGITILGSLSSISSKVSAENVNVYLGRKSSFSDSRIKTAAQTLFSENETETYLNLYAKGSIFARVTLRKFVPETTSGTAVLEAYKFVMHSISATGVRAELVSMPALASGESVALFGIKDGKLAEPVMVCEGAGTAYIFNLSEWEGFALVKIVPVKSEITSSAGTPDGHTVYFKINGVVPEGSEIKAELAEGEFDSDAILAYDISIADMFGREYQPDENNPVSVKIKSSVIERAIASGLIISVTHYDEEGNAEEIEITDIGDNFVTFNATSFSVYTINASNPGKNLVSYYETREGTYSSVVVSGTCKKIPVLNMDSVVGKDNVTIVESWDLGNIKNGTSLKLYLTVNQVPELEDDEYFAIYLIKNGNFVSEAEYTGKTIVVDVDFKGNTGVALAVVKDTVSSELVPDNAIWANDDIYLTGKMPGNAVVDATPVTVTVDGEEVICAYDIKIYANENMRKKGKTWKPAGDKVKVHFRNAGFEGIEELNVYHFGDETELVKTTKAENNWIEFDAGSFSIYAVSTVILEKTITASDGNTYLITASYDTKTTGIPSNTVLEVREIGKDEEGFDGYIKDSLDVIGAENYTYARAFDIRIVNADDNSISYQPAEGTMVNVSIKLMDAQADADDFSVVHFGEQPELISSTTTENTVIFKADGFSVYMIIDHEGGEVNVEHARVEFHFIAGTTNLPDTTTEPGVALYTAGPYVFRNKSDDVDAGKTQVTMIVQNGDTLESIEAPREIGDSNFFGWYTVDMKSDTTTYNTTSHTFSGQIVYSWPDDTQRVELDNTITISDVVTNASGAITSLKWTINGVSQTVSTNIDAEGCAHVYLAPIYTNYNFVNFHLAPYGDQADAYIMTRKLIVLGNSEHTDIRVGDIKSTYQDPSYYRFVGWEYLADDKGTADTTDDTWVQILSVNDDDTEINNALPKVGTYLTASGRDYDLYPIFVEIRWITFNRGAAHNGSEYLEPQYIRTSDSGAGTFTVSSFYGSEKARRVGYNFKGWYLNACFGNGNDFLNESNGNEGFDYTTTVDGVSVITHYGKIIQLTDENGNFVEAVRGKDFYTFNHNNNNIQMVNTGANLPDGAAKLFSVDAAGKLSVYTGIYDRLPVYAKWEAKASSSYKVVIWMQRSSDSADAINISQHDTWVAAYIATYKAANPSAKDDEVKAAAETAWDAVCKHYDFYEYHLRFAAGNAIVSPTTGSNGADLNKTTSTQTVTYNGQSMTESDIFTGFQLGEYDQNVTVDPQGTTVLNVYYDRKTVTLTFRVYDYIYTVSTGDNDNNPEKYGDVDGQKVRVYWRSGAFRTSNRDNGTVYNGTVYTRSSNRSWHDYLVMSGLYKQTLAEAGYTWPDELWWYSSYTVRGNNYSGSGTRTTFLDAFYLSDGSMSTTFYGFTGSGSNHVYFYQEQLDGSWVVVNDMTSGDGNFNISDKYEGFTASEYSTNGGSTWIPLTGKDSNGYYATGVSVSNGLHIRYTRNIYSVTFMPNYPGEIDTTNLTQSTLQDYTSGLNGSEKKTFVVVNIPYGQTISNSTNIAAVRALQDSGVAAENKYPLIPVEHRFEGWFVDASASVKYNFDDTMPAGNVVVYAGWSMIKYRIIVDPNGGILDHINYPVYGSILNKTGLDINSSYNDAYATFFNNTAAEYIVTDFDPVNPMVKIDNAEAARRVAENLPVYRYVNMLYTKAENLNGGIYSSYAADARNALYILDTAESRAQYYNYYCQVIADKNDGTAVPTQEMWESLFLSKEKYRPLDTGESYTFLGWYEYFEDTGELADTPFDFSMPASHRTHLIAQWRLDGGYTLHYHPDYVFIDTDGTEYALTGSMEEFYDPNPKSVIHQYSDGATTQAMEEPSAIKINGVPDNEGLFQFRGWQIVKIRTVNHKTVYEVPDEEVGVYYTAGQTIVVHGRYAQEEVMEDGFTTKSVIHLRAVYEKRDDAYRRPDIINLIIDAGQDGTLDTNGNPTPVGQGYVNITDSSLLPTWSHPGHQYISTDTRAVDINGTTQQKPYRILLGDVQSNTALHLYKYATLLTKSEVTNEPLDPAGQVFFTHPAGYKLIGFDLDAPDNDFIPDYPADAVIAVSPNESHILYAVWEPMVYITFVNDTHVDNPISFRLSGTNRAMYVVSKTNGSFSREPVDTSKDIVLAKNESITFVMPYGSGENLTVTGTNNLGTGYILSATSELGITNPTESSTMTGSPNGAASDYTGISNGSAFGFTEKMLTHEEGLVVTFTAEKAPHTLILEDNYSGGGSKEVNFKENALNVVYYGTESVTSYTLPSTSTRLGFELLGWDEDPDATDPTYKNSNWMIDPLTSFFTSGGSTIPDIDVKTLYAIWKPNSVASTVLVWKDVPEPGDQTKDFVFTVSFNGEFYYTRSDREWTWSGYNYYWETTPRSGVIGTNTAAADGTPILSYDFTLAHNQYLKIVTEKETDNGERPSLTMTVEKWQHYTDGRADARLDADNQRNGVQDNVVLSWYWQNTTTAADPPTDRNQYRSFNFRNLEMSVKENDYTSRYDLNVEAVTGTASPLNGDASERKAYWDDTFAGGTVVFHNTRKTADITITKTLLPDTLEAESFRFGVEFTNGTDATHYEGYELTPTSEYVVSGTGSWTISGIPTGAQIKITEAVENSRYETTAAGTTTAAVTDLDAFDNIFEFVLDDDTEINFTNTLKYKNIRIVLVDDETPTPNNLTGGAFTLPGIFDGTYLASAGLIYEGKAYVGSYTLTQHNAPSSVYKKLQSIATLNVTGIDGNNAVTVTTGDGDTISVSYDSGSDVYTITVVNPKLMLVTVKKLIEANSNFFKTSAVGFTAVLKDSSNNPIQVSNVIGDRGTDANGEITFILYNNQSETLYIPRNAKLEVTETPDVTFKTVYQTGPDEENLGSKIESNVVTINSVTKDSFMLFTNTLKTIKVRVSKTVVGIPGTFNFTAFLRFNDHAVMGYVLTTGIVTGDGSGPDAPGHASFTLSPLTVDGTAYVVFEIPSGSVLVLTEEANDEYYQSYKVEKDSSHDTISSDNALSVTLTDTQTVEDLTVTFTNTEIKVAPTAVNLESRPYTVILGIGALLVLFLMVSSLKRRKLNEDPEDPDPVYTEPHDTSDVIRKPKVYRNWRLYPGKCRKRMDNENPKADSAEAEADETPPNRIRSNLLKSMSVIPKARSEPRSRGDPKFERVKTRWRRLLRWEVPDEALAQDNPEKTPTYNFIKIERKLTRMKTFKRISSIVLALAMVLTMSAFVFADDDTYKGSGNTNAITGTGNRIGETTIPLTKGIVFFNANSVTDKVYEPNITFTYTVAPASIKADGSEATVTDNQDPAVIQKVYPGPAGGVTGTDIVFSSSKGAKSASPTGVEVEEKGNLTFVPSAFTKPGIYRYVITETVAGTGTDDNAKLKAVGMTARETEYNNVRYLDVYVKYVETPAGSGHYELQMYGAVIFVTHGDASATPSTAGKDSITTSTEKTTGFEPGVTPGSGTAPSNYADDKNVDKYTTYNFTIKKTVSGSLADRNHEFPFYVTVSNSINGARFTYTADDSEAFTGASNASGVVDLTAANFTIGEDAKTSSLTLKNNDKIVLIGLPSSQAANLSVTIKEYNDTYDEYTLKATATKGGDEGKLTTAPTDGKMAPTTGTGALADAFDLKTNDIADQTITFDNNLTEISPTGVVMRIAPYAAILGAGIILLVVARKFKKDDEEEFEGEAVRA